MQSRVWYAHTLVVPEKRESKVNESAVAAAARLALQSTPPVSHSLQRRRPRRFLEAGLLATSAVLLLLVWRQYAGEPPASGDAVAVAASDPREDVPAVLETGTVQRAVEQVPTKVADETALPPADATIPALEEAEPAAVQSRVAGFTAINPDHAAAETYNEAADLPASEFATAPGASGVGELAAIHAGSEIETIEVGEEGREPAVEAEVEAGHEDKQPGTGAAAEVSKEGQEGGTETVPAETVTRTPPGVVSNARSKAPASTGRSANQTRPKKTVKKQSTEVSDFGDCSMPRWAWRAFGFTEEKRRRPC